MGKDSYTQIVGLCFRFPRDESLACLASYVQEDAFVRCDDATRGIIILFLALSVILISEDALMVHLLMNIICI